MERVLPRTMGQMPRVGRLGLSGQLLVALLVIGAIPIVVATTAWYVASRGVIRDQAETALRQLTAQQATHLATELDRQRLLLRTITAQLPAAAVIDVTRASDLQRRLTQSLTDDGVFDGLRLADRDGVVLASVALRNTDPHWPPRNPAADWLKRSTVVHRQNGQVVAYLIAAPIGSDARLWLEGHVRADEFERLLSIPEHLIRGAETAIVDREGRLVHTEHRLATSEFLGSLITDIPDTAAVREDSLAGRPALRATAIIEGSEWIFQAMLPLDAAMEPLARLRNGAVVAAAVLVVIILATATFAARFISTPLRDLATAARRLGETGGYRKITARGTGEVNILVHEFNQMAEDLQRSSREINRLHAAEMERAQQLATVGELASGVAHEIRNPLTGVLGAIELATRRVPEGDSVRPLLEEAETQLRRIEVTTTQLLQFARPPELKAVRVDPHLLLDRAVRIVEPRASRGRIAVVTTSDEILPLVEVDPELMVQVLVNLMLNAIDAIDGEGTLTVRGTGRGHEILLAVDDTGPGVPEDMRSEIFRPFRTSKPKGTGLGLSISRQIVARHGGTIVVSATVGGGACFEVILPVAGGDGER